MPSRESHVMTTSIDLCFFRVGLLSDLACHDVKSLILYCVSYQGAWQGVVIEDSIYGSTFFLLLKVKFKASLTFILPKDLCESVKDA